MRGPQIVEIMGSDPFAWAPAEHVGAVWGSATAGSDAALKAQKAQAHRQHEQRPAMRPPKTARELALEAKLAEVGKKLRAASREKVAAAAKLRRQQAGASRREQKALEEQAKALEEQAQADQARLGELEAQLASMQAQPQPYPPQAPPWASQAPPWASQAPQGEPEPFEFVPVPRPQLPEPLESIEPLESPAFAPESMSGEPEQRQAADEGRLRAALPALGEGERELAHAMYRGALVTVARQRGGWRGSLVLELRGLPPLVVSVLLPDAYVAELYRLARARRGVLARFLRAPSEETDEPERVAGEVATLALGETYRETTRRIDDVLEHPAVRAITSAIPIVSQIAEVARIASGAARAAGDARIVVTSERDKRPGAGFQVRASLAGGPAAERVPVSQRRAAHELAALLVAKDPGAVKVTLELATRAEGGDAGAARALELVRAAKRGAFRRCEVVERVGANPENPWQAAGLYR